MNKNLIRDFGFAHVEDLAAAAFNLLEAARVRNWKVCSDGSRPVVVVADPVVVAAAAVEVALHGVPFGGDVAVIAVPSLNGGDR